MKPFKHVLNTWLLAHLLHPFIFTLFFLIVDKVEIGWYFLFFFILGIIVSFPSLLFTTLLCDIIAEMPLAKWSKIIIWSAVVCVCITVNVIVVLLFFEFFPVYESFQVIIPALLSVIASIIIRHRQFENYVMYPAGNYNEQSELTVDITNNL